MSICGRCGGDARKNGRRPEAESSQPSVVIDSELRRDQLIALMVAELDADLRDHGPVQAVAWPDDDDHVDKAVELIARDATGAEVAIEHTRIESFPGQMADRLAIHEYFRRGGPQISGRNDAGKYRLSVLPGAPRGLSRRQRKRVPSVLTEWVAGNLDRAPWPHRPGEPNHLIGSHPDLPFRWALRRWVPDAIGLVGPDANVVPIDHATPPDSEGLREQRLARALADKVPKLLAAADRHRRSILVLEDRDPDMSAPLLVSRALQAAVGDLELPDVIYTLLTRSRDPIMGVLYECGAWAHEHDDFRWRTFPRTRCGELNAMDVTWA